MSVLFSANPEVVRADTSNTGCIFVVDDESRLHAREGNSFNLKADASTSVISHVPELESKVALARATLS